MHNQEYWRFHASKYFESVLSFFGKYILVYQVNKFSWLVLTTFTCSVTYFQYIF